MRKKLMAGVGILVSLVMLMSCSGGVSQAKYNSVVAERDNALAKLSKAQSDLKAAQEQIADLEAGGATSGGLQTGPTDITQVLWRPVLYINKVQGFKLYYPSGWNITQENTRETVPVEIHAGNPGSWVSLINNSDTYNWTSMTLEDVALGVFAQCEVLSSGTTTLADGTTPGAYCEFNALIDEQYFMHCYSVGYIDGNRWLLFVVWTIEESLEWDAGLMRSVAHTFCRATATEIAGATATTVSPTTTTQTTATTTTAKTNTPGLSFNAATYNDSTYNFSFSYNSDWTANWSGDNNPVSLGDPNYFDPSVRIIVLPSSTGTTLAAVLKSEAFEKAIVAYSDITIEDQTLANITNTHNITATPVLLSWGWQDGTTAQTKAFGFLKNGNWFIMICTISSGWNMGVDTIYPDEIFSTWTFS